MATQIDQDAALILSVLAVAPRNDYIPALDIAKNAKLSPDRVNDAVALLVDAGLVEWLQVMGTAPFDFGDAMITPRGRRELQRTAAEEAPAPSVAPEQRAKIQLFISHASADVELARRLVVLISTALNLPAAAIRCTSVDGYRLPGGVNTNEQLRREVHDSTAFIGIVSHSSLRSMYVLFELGARWGASKNLIPLVAHGVPISVMSGPLSGLNALRADNSSQLHQLVQDVGRQLSITPQSPAVFDRALQELLGTPATEPQSAAVAPTPTESLPKEADDVLVALAKEEGQTPEDLAAALSLSATKAEYLLDLLEARDFVGSVSYVGRASEYYLEKGGRKYLVERGLVS